MAVSPPVLSNSRKNRRGRRVEIRGRIQFAEKECGRQGLTQMSFVFDFADHSFQPCGIGRAGDYSAQPGGNPIYLTFTQEQMQGLDAVVAAQASCM